MLEINGIQIAFDITSPVDVTKLKKAQETAASIEISEPPADQNDPAYLDRYVEWLNTLLGVFGNFIDDAFGNGMAEQLLTNNPSLTKVLEVNEALEKALGVHVDSIASKFSKYAPNRATRRAK